MLDSLNYIYMLRRLDPPVGVYFEAEKLNTLDKSSDMIITVLSLVAQSESEQSPTASSGLLRDAGRRAWASIPIGRSSAIRGVPGRSMRTKRMWCEPYTVFIWRAKETRRHYSLEGKVYEGMDYAVEDSGLEALFAGPTDEERLHAAIRQLSPTSRKWSGLSILKM